MAQRVVLHRPRVSDERKGERSIESSSSHFPLKWKFSLVKFFVLQPKLFSSIDTIEIVSYRQKEVEEGARSSDVSM